MEMKRQAVQYYNENQVPKELESLLNAMFFERPQDLYGYMVCVCVFFFSNYKFKICSKAYRQWKWQRMVAL